ncbi:MAG: sigma-70 family RNA polymerase sigma factor [Vicinamibacterales bacterium]
MANQWMDDLTVSQETSLSLLGRAQGGDGVAMEALMGRYLTRLQRWAHGRLPARARTLLDTDDLVQDTLLGTLRNLGHFQPRHDGALLAYLREAVSNRVRNELRRRVPATDGESVLDALPSDQPSPLDAVVSRRSLERYEQALAQLDDTERAAIIARFEMGYSYDALARALERPTPDAARKVTERALRRLVALMRPDE